MYPEIDPATRIEQLTANDRGGAFSFNFDTSQDAALAVRFYMDVRRNVAKSKQEGRLVCDDVEMIEIRIPGGGDIIRHEVGDGDKERFPKQYAAFRGGQSQDRASGTPLQEWPLMTRGQVEEAAFFGVRTVEALAAVQDSNLQRMGAGWKDIRRKAADWLQKAKDGAMLNRMREELEERDRRLETLEKMLSEQAKQIEAARANPNGLVGGTPPGTDPLVAELAAQVKQLMLQRAPAAPVAVEVPKRKGGWPKGKPRKPVPGTT